MSIISAYAEIYIQANGFYSTQMVFSELSCQVKHYTRVSGDTR